MTSKMVPSNRRDQGRSQMPESRPASLYKVANILARFWENKEVDRRLAHVTGRFWRNMSNEIYSATNGSSKIIMNVPPDLPLGHYKFEAYVAKQADDTMLISSVSLVEVDPTVQVRDREVASNCDTSVFLLTISIILLLIGLIYKGVKK